MIWLLLGLASAQGVEDTVLERAEQVWREQSGRALLARERGAERAAGSLGVGPSGLYVLSQVGERTQRQVELGVEQPLDFGIARGARTRAEHHVAEVQTAVDRFQHQLEAYDAWSQWWATSVLLEHVEEHAAQTEAQLAPFVQGAESGAVSPASLADLQTAVWLIQGELLDLRREVMDQEILAHQRLGEGALPAGWSLDEPIPEVSPWGDTPPATAPILAEAEALALRAKAREVGAQRLPVAQGGVMWAPNAQDELVPFAVLGLSLPLQSGLGSQRRQLRGAADGARAEAEWAAERFAMDWLREHEQWLALRHDVTARRQDVVQPLFQRSERLRQAAQDGLVPLTRWVQASRDYREAEHDVLRLTAALQRSTSRARALRTLLESP